MSDSTRTLEDVGMVLKSARCCNSEDVTAFYDQWAENYERDVSIINYQAPNLALEIISSNFRGNPEEARVLDVACGAGQLAKLMSEYGFRHFVGTDCSSGMLQEAGKTGLYVELKLANLGSEPLPAEEGTFDLVMMVGALQPNLVPFSVLRELCHATKPGGLICFTKADHKNVPEDFTASLEKELQLLEDEQLWDCLDLKRSDRYMKDTSMCKEGQDEMFVSGIVYLFRKALV